MAALPGRESEFQQAFDTALSYGAEIGASAVHCMAGVLPAEQHAAAERTFVENLKIRGRQGRAGLDELVARADQSSG